MPAARVYTGTLTLVHWCTLVHTLAVADRPQLITAEPGKQKALQQHHVVHHDANAQVNHMVHGSQTPKMQVELSSVSTAPQWRADTSADLLS